MRPIRDYQQRPPLFNRPYIQINKNYQTNTYFTCPLPQKPFFFLLSKYGLLQPFPENLLSFSFVTDQLKYWVLRYDNSLISFKIIFGLQSVKVRQLCQLIPKYTVANLQHLNINIRLVHCPIYGLNWSSHLIGDSLTCKQYLKKNRHLKNQNP